MKYYVKTKNGYASLKGYVTNIVEADVFDETQLIKRFKTTLPNLIKVAKLSNFELIPENKDAKLTVSGQKHTKFDILFCNGTFTYKKGLIKKEVVYSEFRNNLRIPNSKKLGELIKIDLEIIKIVGTVNCN